MIFWLYRRGFLASALRNVLYFIPYAGGNCHWTEGILGAGFCSVPDLILGSSMQGTNTLVYSGKADEHMLNFQFINASLNSVGALCAWPQLKFEPKYLRSVGSDPTTWTIVFFGRAFGNCAKLLWAEIHSVTPIVPLYLCLLLKLFQHCAIFHVSSRSGNDWLFASIRCVYLCGACNYMEMFGACLLFLILDIKHHPFKCKESSCLAVGSGLAVRLLERGFNELQVFCFSCFCFLPLYSKRSHM